MSYKVSKIPGLKKNDRRLVLFVECQTDEFIDAKKTFSGFKSKNQHTVLSRFEYWIDGNKHDLYFHGWNDESKKHCFTFKWREGRSRCRLYGFIFKARDSRLVRLEVCVLAYFARKFTEDTDPSIINALNTLRELPAVINALEDFLIEEYELTRQDNEVARTSWKRARA